MTSVLSSHPRSSPFQACETFLKSRANKIRCVGYSGLQFPPEGALSAQGQQNSRFFGKIPQCRLICVRAVSDDAEPSSSDDGSQDDEPFQSENKEVNGGPSRDDLEKLVGNDDSSFSGKDLATLIRKKYGRSYDVQFIKKEFMGRNLLALNVMWKYMEQRSFPLTEEEYILRLDDVANTLRCWGAVSHIKNTLARSKERPRIGKAVSIFIDMDESGGRANEWIYK